MTVAALEVCCSQNLRAAIDCKYGKQERVEASQVDLVDMDGHGTAYMYEGPEKLG